MKMISFNIYRTCLCVALINIASKHVSTSRMRINVRREKRSIFDYRLHKHDDDGEKKERILMYYFYLYCLFSLDCVWKTHSAKPLCTLFSVCLSSKFRRVMKCSLEFPKIKKLFRFFQSNVDKIDVDDENDNTTNHDVFKQEKKGTIRISRESERCIDTTVIPRMRYALTQPQRCIEDDTKENKTERK